MSIEVASELSSTDEAIDPPKGLKNSPLQSFMALPNLVTQLKLDLGEGHHTATRMGWTSDIIGNFAEMMQMNLLR